MTCTCQILCIEDVDVEVRDILSRFLGAIIIIYKNYCNLDHVASTTYTEIWERYLSMTRIL